MTPDDVDDAMRLVGAAWPGQTFTREQLALWHQTLAPLELPRVSDAIGRCVAGPNGRWRPDPGAFMETYRATSAPRQLAETRAVSAQYAMTDDEFERGRDAMRAVLAQCRAVLSARSAR